MLHRGLIMIFSLGWLASLCLVQPVSAQATPAAAGEQVYARGRILEILDEKQLTDSGLNESEQTVIVKVLNGEDRDETQVITYTFSANNFAKQKLQPKDAVVLAKVTNADNETFYILDNYRLPSLVVLALVFAVVAIVLGRRQGLGSLAGLALSLAVLMFFVVPRIIAGQDPLLVAFIGSCVIACVSILLAHGFKRRSFVSLVATLGTLALALVLTLLVAPFASLFGTGTEEAVYLQIGYLPNLNLSGFLFAGVIIGVLGVLDDVTTAQVAAVEEISLANPSLDAVDLYKRGLSVGREHIASLVNTLILAYAGASFSLFLLFVLPDHPPLWVVLNSETLGEEMVRGLIGGLALMLAVPLATFLAASIFGKRQRPTEYV